MVQRTVRADLQAFRKALVEILMPHAAFDPFKQDNNDGNATAKEDTTSDDVTLMKDAEAGAAIHGSIESVGKEAEAQSDDDDDEFRASICAAAAQYEGTLFASKQSFDKLCDKGLSAFDDSCMTEDNRGKSMIADLDNHHDTSWDCSLSFTTAKQSSTDEKRQSIMKEDSERSAEKTAPSARQSTLTGLTHDAGVENAVFIPIGELAQKEAAVPVKQLDCEAATETEKASDATPQASNAGRTSGSLQTSLSTPNFLTPEYVQTMRTTEYNIKLRVQSTVTGGIRQNSHETLLKIVEAAITLLRTGDHTIGIMHPRMGGYASFDLEQAAPTPELCERFIIESTANKRNMGDSFCFHLITSHREFGEEPASGKIFSHFGEHYTVFEKALAMANVKLVRMTYNEHDYSTLENSPMISTTEIDNPSSDGTVATALSNATHDKSGSTLIKTDGSPSVSSQESTISISSAGSSSDSEIDLTLSPAKKPHSRPSPRRSASPLRTRAMKLAAAENIGGDIHSNSEDGD